MSNTNKVVKSVAFNKSNPEEKQLLDFVKRRNFSKYVKKLMLQDYVVAMNEKMEKMQNIESAQKHEYTIDHSHTIEQEVYHPQPNADIKPFTNLSSADRLSQMKNGNNWK